MSFENPASSAIHWVNACHARASAKPDRARVLARASPARAADRNSPSTASRSRIAGSLRDWQTLVHHYSAAVDWLALFVDPRQIERRRPTLGNPIELQHDVSCCLPTLIGLLSKTSVHHVIERGRQVVRAAFGSRRRDWCRLPGQNGCNQARLTRLRSARPSGHLVEQRAQREDVGAFIALPAVELLGREAGTCRRWFLRPSACPGETTASTTAPTRVRALVRGRNPAASRPTQSA